MPSSAYADSGASVDKNTGFVSATVFLSKDYGERYIFPFTAQASDIQNTDTYSIL